jgi:hypothetical protein
LREDGSRIAFTMSLFKRATKQPSGRIARKLLRATFAAGAVKGAAKARIERTGRHRIPILAGIGAAVAAAFAAGRRSAQHEHPEPQPFPDRPPLRAAEANGSSDAPDPSAQSLSDG